MGAIFSATTEGERTLSSASTKTMMEWLGDADVTAVLTELSISMAGTSSADRPVLWELYQITATGTGTAATEVKWSRRTPTAQVQCKYAHTVEPTKVDRIATWEVHPQGGLFVIQWPLGREPVICDGSASQGLALVYTTASSVTPPCVVYGSWEE